MAGWFDCPYLGGEVELTDERERHIHERHADLIPGLEDLVGGTLLGPDAIHPSASYPTRLLFSRWYSELLGGKYVLVAVETQPVEPMRYWIVTAHMLRKPVPGEAIWRRS
jgi:hypothetical protein